MAQYDAIAEPYSRLNERQPIQVYAAYPALWSTIGCVRDKEVLDMGCGEGIVAREAARRGAARVVAVDESRSMLDHACRKHPIGAPIEYRHGHVGSLGVIGQFDQITGAYLLHYANPVSELFCMAADICANLRPGGIFTGINHNPVHSLHCIDRDEGSSLRWAFKIGNELVLFTNYFYRKETYGAAFQNVGMKLEWLPIAPTDEGRRCIDPELLNRFEAAPWLSILRARKL